MKRSIPWIVATVALIAFGASFFQLHQARERYWTLAGFQSRDHLHRETREFMIRAALTGLDRPIIVLGDSITEMARLPEEIDGHPVVNAGIGGATISDFEVIAPRLLEDFETPSLIVVALGANDIGDGDVTGKYTELLFRLKKMAPRLLAIGVAGPDGSDVINRQIKQAAEAASAPFIDVELPSAATLSDRIHLNAAGYRVWTRAVVAAIANATEYHKS
jgi:lysophospholipase L1-like esterase